MKMTRKLRNVFSSDAGYRVFPTGGMGEGASPFTSQKFAHSSPPRKIPPSTLPLPPPNFYSPTTKQRFSSYNPIKTAFLGEVIAPAPFLF